MPPFCDANNRHGSRGAVRGKVVEGGERMAIVALSVPRVRTSLWAAFRSS